MIFQRERASEILAEIIPLTEKHHKECSRFIEIPLDPNYQLYLDAEKLGRLCVFTARKGSRLCGYAVFFIQPHPHYSKTIQAFCSLLFIDPEYRGAGMRFIRFCDEALASEGVKIISHTVTTQMDYSKLLTRLGYEPAELIFERKI